MNRPSAGPLAELSEEDFSEFIIRLGLLVYRTPATAAFARHTRPLNTIKDYIDVLPTDPPLASLAKEFWRDLAGRGRMTTDELCQKWYGKNEAEMRSDVTNNVF